MTTSPLFSTYRQGENRVADTFLSVLQRLSLPSIDHILGALLGETGFSLVTFENQPIGKRMTPDARIKTGPAIWIETTTARGTVDLDQIRKLLKGVSKVYVCTPNRSFKPADRIAFYAEGAIQPLTPKIGPVIESIDVRQQDQIDSLDRSRKELAQVLHGKIEEKPHPYFGGNIKIMFLSGPDDTETVKL